MIVIRTAAILLVVTLLLACGVVELDSQGAPGLGKADRPGWAEGDTDVALLENEVRDYRVLFTNPRCSGLTYGSPIPTADGSGQRFGKPRFVYCNDEDFGPSAERQLSPQYNLLRWISQLQSGDELFLAYLSYSNDAVHSVLCQAVQRGVKIDLVLDKIPSLANQLKECAPANVRLLARGQSGGSIGFAHNKLLMINPHGDSEYIKLTFGSGNMSTGTLIHHENWHFIEVRRASYFAQAHRCLVQAQLDDAACSSKGAYREFMNACRRAIVEEMGYQEEQDARAFFIPNSDDYSKLRLLLGQSIMSAAEVDIAAHRFGSAYKSFSHDGVRYLGFQPDMIHRLQQTQNPVRMRMVADDDMYWLLPYGNGRPFGATTWHNVGLNQYLEAQNTRALYEAGGGERFEIRYLETNHSYRGTDNCAAQRNYRLHHNKFVIYRGMPGKRDAVLCGAANLTGAGFKDNFENIYWITIPSVVEAYNRQMERFWNGRRFAGDDQDPPVATAPGQMPAELPPPDGDPCWNQ